MSGKVPKWPDWPEFTTSNAEKCDDLAAFKAAIIKEYGQEALTKSWLKTCKALETLTATIAEKGNGVIPEVAFDKISTMTPESRTALKDIGCFKIKGVIPKEQADQWFQELKHYLAANKDKVSGWPKETPFILRMYFSPTQVAARSHPNMLKLSRELNSWWRHESDESVYEPLSYADGIRIRPPGQPFYGLGPHIDAGSLCRWVDPVYQSYYRPVFSGEPENLDCYNLNLRKDANQVAFAGGAHSTVFRAFQGWTALSPAAPGEGSLMLYPNVKLSVAYLLLRPFFAPPTSQEDIMDASKWTFDATTPFFPGTFRDDSQYLSPSSHPHLRLKECMVSIPAMQPGDTIWWHADMCHAVEVEHNGANEACVAYIAATPSTEGNKKYMAEQLKAFLSGAQPEDFRQDGAVSEKNYVGYAGEAGILSGEAGRRAMGFEIAAA